MNNRSILHKPNAAGTQGQPGQQNHIVQQDKQPNAGNTQSGQAYSGEQLDSQTGTGMNRSKQQDRNINLEERDKAVAVSDSEWPEKTQPGQGRKGKERHVFKACFAR